MGIRQPAASIRAGEGHLAGVRRAGRRSAGVWSRGFSSAHRSRIQSPSRGAWGCASPVTLAAPGSLPASLSLYNHLDACDEIFAGPREAGGRELEEEEKRRGREDCVCWDFEAAILFSAIWRLGDLLGLGMGCRFPGQLTGAFLPSAYALGVQPYPPACFDQDSTTQSVVPNPESL